MTRLTAAVGKTRRRGVLGPRDGERQHHQHQPGQPGRAPPEPVQPPAAGPPRERAIRVAGQQPGGRQRHGQREERREEPRVVVVEIVRQQERRHYQHGGDHGEPVECGRRAAGRQPGGGEQAGQQRQGDHGQHRQGGRREMRSGQPGHLLNPERQRNAAAGPGQLRDDHAVKERAGRGDGERQDRNEEPGRHPGQEPGRPPGAGQAQHQDDRHRDDRPHLDRAGEAECRAAPGQPAAAGGQLVAVEHGHGAGQAGEHQPWLQQDRVGGLHAARIHGQDPAGNDDGEHAAMTHQQPAEQHAGGAGQGGQDPAGRHRPGRGGQLGQQRGRPHQQRDPRRLDGDEVAVRDGAADQPERAAEVRAVVVLGDAEQVAGTGQLVHPQPEPEQRRHRDHDAGRGARDEAAQAALGRRVVPRRAGRGPHGGTAHDCFPTRACQPGHQPTGVRPVEGRADTTAQTPAGRTGCGGGRSARISG